MRQYKSPAIHRTPLYRAKAAYCGMLARCGNRNGKNPAYASVELRMTKAEWLAWAVPQYEAFLSACPNETPNASRRNDCGHYEIGNIEIVSLSENRSVMTARSVLMMKADGTKMCSSCGKTKIAAVHFSRHRSRADGYCYDCKKCWKDRRARHRVVMSAQG